MGIHRAMKLMVLFGRFGCGYYKGSVEQKPLLLVVGRKGTKQKIVPFCGGLLV